MSENIISFEEAKLRVSHHIAGEAVCLGCRHVWVAVAPTGSTEFECPSCKTMSGVWSALCMPDEEIMRCNFCQNDYFFITREAALCPKCGTEVPYPDL